MNEKLTFEQAKACDNIEDAAEVYTSIIEKYPGSRYATLAYRELNEINELKKIQKDNAYISDKKEKRSVVGLALLAVPLTPVFQFLAIVLPSLVEVLFGGTFMCGFMHGSSSCSFLNFIESTFLHIFIINITVIGFLVTYPITFILVYFISNKLEKKYNQ
mgnify:CR=1 FL=1